MKNPLETFVGGISPINNSQDDLSRDTTIKKFNNKRGRNDNELLFHSIRRKSCHCKDCGNLSKLEWNIQDLPYIINKPLVKQYLENVAAKKQISFSQKEEVTQIKSVLNVKTISSIIHLNKTKAKIGVNGTLPPIDQIKRGAEKFKNFKASPIKEKIKRKEECETMLLSPTGINGNDNHHYSEHNENNLKYNVFFSG